MSVLEEARRHERKQDNFCVGIEGLDFEIKKITFVSDGDAFVSNNNENVFQNPMDQKYDMKPNIN